VPLDVATLEPFLKKQPTPGLLVIDSFRGAFMLGRDEEKDAGVTGGILRTLQRVARATGWAIILIHHERKSGSGNFLDGSGSGEWLAVPDAIWMWTRSRPAESGILRITGRMPPVDDLSIRLSPSECRCLGTAQEARKQEDFAGILAHLPGSDDDPITVESVLENWGNGAPSKTTLYEKLNRLHQDCRVSQTGVGGKSDPHRYRQAMV